MCRWISVSGGGVSEGGVHGGSGSAGSERGSRWALKMASLATHRAPTILLERPCGANLEGKTLTGSIFFQGGPADFGGKIHFIKSGSLRIRRRVIPPNGGRGIGLRWGNPRVSTGKWHFEIWSLASCHNQKRGFAIISPSINSPAFNPRPGSAPLPASPPPGPKKIAAPQFRTWSPTALLSVALSSLTSVDRTGNSASCLVWPQPNYKKNKWPVRSKFN